MDATEIKAGYVITDTGSVFLQIPDPTSRWGFWIVDDDRGWDGGFGLGSDWELMADDDPRITDDDRERLGHILEDARA